MNIQKMNEGLSALQELLAALLEMNEKQTTRQLIDNTDLRNLLHVSDKTIYRMRKAKKIPFVHIGKKYYYPLAFFQNFEKPLPQSSVDGP